MKRARSTHPWLRFAAALAAFLVAGAAHAQLLRGPSLPMPQLPLPQVPAVAPVQQQVQQHLQQTVRLQDLRATLARELVRGYPQIVEADPAGEPIRRAELLWLSPSPAAIEAARAEGFAVLREENLEELGIRDVVMRAPAALATAAAADRLRALDPQAQVDFNHLYVRSGEVAPAASAPRMVQDAGAAFRIGLVDGGVERSHASLRHATIRAWGCEGREVASEHGTAVASLLARARSTVYAADVYCEQPAGGAAEDVARALAWMVRERVAVINVSLVGPPNRLLERAVAAVLRAGHVVVAAVGNDGPAAPPLYPASYPGVVGVTGVTTANRVLPEAAQGPQVMFAAPGADLEIARRGGGRGTARGTSFAAPFVAGLLAMAVREPDAGAASRAIARLARDAIDLGVPGRDPVYGFGLVREPAH